MSLDWDDFKDLSQVDDVLDLKALSPLDKAFLLTALDYLEREEWVNDDKDTREALIADLYDTVT